MKTRASVRRIIISLSVVAGLMFWASHPLAAPAQVLYGSIVGTVTDPSTAAIPKAAVKVTNKSTGLIRETFTDLAGFYTIPNLPDGTYDVTVSANGFRPVTQTNVDISINNATRADITLQVGGVTESVTIQAAAAALQTTKSDVNVNLEGKTIANLPLPGYRNFQSLINLVPGATPGRFQNAVIDTPQRDLTFNVNGQDRGNNNTRVDGSANILVTMPHHMVYVPPVESIEEVNISTNNFEAEQGMTGGAAVTVTTKSGTNDLHGSAFAFHSNNVLRAFWWDENRVGVKTKPKSIRNMDGASLGGPIQKNKLFFFGNWEGTFERVGRSSLFSVPAEDLRTGDFSRKLGVPIMDSRGNSIMVPTTEGATTQLRQGMIFDPFTGNVDGTGRAVFSSNNRLNVIPASRLNPAMQKLVNLIPKPNQTGDVNNFFNQGTQRLNRNNLDAKINWNRTAEHQLWFKYGLMDALVNGEFGLGAAGGGCLCDGGVGAGSTLVQTAAIGQTYTFSPTFLVDGTLGWTRFGQQVESPDLGVNFGSDTLGIPGTNGPDPRESGMPSFSLGSDYSTLGNTEGWNPLYRNDQSYTFNINASLMKTSHEIRFGFDFIHHLMNHWQPELGSGPRGSFSFGNAVTALNPSAIGSAAGFQGGTPSFENGWNGLAGMLLGTPTSAGKSAQYIKMDSLENQWALYFRDRWRVNSKFTLNLGLRWELFPNRTRSAGLGIEAYDPATNEVLVGGRGNVPRDAGVGYSKRMFAPRVGFAYQLTGNTVIRSGYGITNHSHPWGAQALRGWFPLTLVASFSGVNGYQPVTTDPNYVALGIPNAPLGGRVGIPPICCPDISTGRVPLPLSNEMGYPVANKQLNRGYIQSWNFIIERKLPSDMLVSVGYVGTSSVNGFAFLDVNASQVPGSGNNGRRLYTRFRRTTTTREFDGRTHSTYHSLQATVNRQMSKGLFLKGAYTWSHAIDMANYGDWTAFSWNADIVFYRNRANAANNIPHMFQVGWVYDFPFGRSKRWASNGFGGAVLGDWQLNGMFSAYQGRQYMLSASGSSLNMPGNAQTPDQIKPVVEKIGLAGDDGPWFDTTAFARVSEVRFGNVGRNTMRGPGVVNADLSLFRTFRLTEAFNLQFRAESFNISNTPHFNNPNGNANSALFGRITSTQNNADAVGRSREYRFGLRLTF